MNFIEYIVSIETMIDVIVKNEKLFESRPLYIFSKNEKKRLKKILNFMNKTFDNKLKYNDLSSEEIETMITNYFNLYKLFFNEIYKKIE